MAQISNIKHQQRDFIDIYLYCPTILNIIIKIEPRQVWLVCWWDEGLVLKQNVKSYLKLIIDAEILEYYKLFIKYFYIIIFFTVSQIVKSHHAVS